MIKMDSVEMKKAIFKILKRYMNDLLAKELAEETVEEMKMLMRVKNGEVY